MKIYRLEHRIPVKLGEVTFWLGPISHEQRTKIFSFVKPEGSPEKTDHVALSNTALRFSIKGIEGVEYPDGSPYQLSFDSDGGVSDECLSELMQLEAMPKIIALCSQFLTQGFGNGSVEGVEIHIGGLKVAEKKSQEGSSLVH